MNGGRSRKTPLPAHLVHTGPESASAKMSLADTGLGDTQPLSQSVLDSLIQRKSFQPSQDGSGMDLELGEDEGTIRMTLREGDPGHIDLLAGYGETEGDHDVTPSEHGEDGSSSKAEESSPSHLESHIFPESQRFLMTTPATVEKQREMSNRATTTPSLPRNPLAAELGSSGGIMALSQVFKATQAPSSPFGHGLTSELPFDRPSPDIPIQSRPLGAFFSPSRTPGSTLRRGYTEPSGYITMEESQTRREKLFEERRTRPTGNINSEDQSDDEFAMEPSFVERRNRQKRIDEEVAAELASVTAASRTSPRRPGSRQSVSRPASIAEPSPTVRGRVAAIFPFGEDAADETKGPRGHLASTGGISEEETEQEDEVVVLTDSQTRQHVSSSEEDKENYNGPPISTPGSAVLAHDRLSQALDLQNSSELPNTPPAEDELQLDQDIKANQIAASSQIINVRDSQSSPSQRDNRQKGVKEGRVSQHALPVGHSCGLERIQSSPITGSPARKRQRLHEITDRDDPVPINTQPDRLLSKSVSHVRSGSEPFRDHPSQNDLPSTGNGNMADKSSSMPSHVANTPLNKQIDDTIPETSIPESSPNRFRHETVLEDTFSRLPPMPEDNELPTPRHKRTWTNNEDIHSVYEDSENRPLRSRRPRSERLFSSPSGKPIMAMTQIREEKSSPQAAPGSPDEEFTIMTNDDREFGNILGFGLSPLPPKKKRRTNVSQSLPVSDPAVPSTTRKDSFGAMDRPGRRQREPTITQAAEPTYEPVVVRRQQRRPMRRTENVWEVEASPRNSTSIAPQRPQTSCHSDERSQGARKTKKASGLPPVVVHQEPSLSQVESSHPTQSDSTQQHPSISISSAIHPNIAQDPAAISTEAQTPAPEEEVCAPNSVLACWTGPKRSYHPATCLSSTGVNGQQRFVVKFDDGNVLAVPIGSVKRLELRVGDGVKVDLPDVPKVTHIVRGFSNKLSAEELSKENHGLTDVHGYSTVVLVAKQRKSLPGGRQPESLDPIEVSFSYIYLDMILWNQLKERSFTFDAKSGQLSTRLQTPTGRFSTPGSPSSRLSRSLLLTRTGLFAGMVFAVSFVQQDDVKTRVTKLITENGGRILRDGFEELFEFPSSVPPVTPSKSSTQANASGHAIMFRPAEGAESIGFACLVADTHSRRAKYMQALALNVPCLSGRWVEDCVRQNCVLGWESYLLPAGASRYLYGGIKSRSLVPTPADRAQFVDTIAKRPKLLDGQSVLLVMGRGKAEERRKAYIFLTYALGAARVERVLDLKAAKDTLQECNGSNGEAHWWDWIYVDDREEAAAKSMIIGKATSMAGKFMSQVGRKRKRSSTLIESISEKATPNSDKEIRIVSNEFVCQSLILGRVYEES